MTCLTLGRKVMKNFEPRFVREFAGSLDVNRPLGETVQVVSNDKQSTEPSALEQADRRRQNRERVKARIKAACDSGTARPLAELAGTEAELNAHAAALTRLANYSDRRPDPNLLVHQLARTVNAHAGGHLRTQLIGDTVSLYSALGSQDATESILHRLLVAVNNITLNCSYRAELASDPRARDVNLRNVMRGATTACIIVRLRDERRDQRRRVNVGRSSSNPRRRFVGKVGY
jgi:hypothetical protein